MILARRFDLPIHHSRENLFRMLQPTYDFVTTSPTDHRFYHRIVRCSSFSPKYGSYNRPETFHHLPYVCLGLWSNDLSKDTYYSLDGVPRFVSINEHVGNTHTHAAITISLRGTGFCSFTTIHKDEMAAMSLVRLTASDVRQIVSSERHYYHDSFDLSVRLRGSDDWDLHECGFNFEDIMHTLWDITEGSGRGAFSRTVMATNALFPEPMLVPPAYPFSVPLAFTSGCDRAKPCGMCKLGDVGRRQPTIDEIKHHIDNWAPTLGRLTNSTQSVFIGRNNLLALPFDLILEALAYLKAPATVEKLTAGLRPQFVSYMDQKVNHWGNIGKLGAFVTVPGVLSLTTEQLSELRKNGLAQIYLSLETGSDRLRSSLLGKEYSTENVVEAAKRLLEGGFSVNVIFMLGISGKDSEEHVAETKAAIAKIVTLLTNETEYRLRFLFAPLHPAYAPSTLATNSDPTIALDELTKLGRLVLPTGRTSYYFDPHSGYEMKLDNGSTIRLFPYHYPTLFV